MIQMMMGEPRDQHDKYATSKQRKSTDQANQSKENTSLIKPYMMHSILLQFNFSQCKDIYSVTHLALSLEDISEMS